MYRGQAVAAFGGPTGKAPRRGRYLLLLGALPGACLLAAATPACAGEAEAAAADAGSGGGSDIVVTAQHRTQAVSNVGIAITAFRGDDLVARGVQNAEQLSQVVPGLVVKDAGFGVPNYTLRGVGFENYFVNSSSTVGLYSDEVAIPYPAMSRGAFFDLERVEVLKGPQGDLYGRNTTAGQISLITRKPTRTFSVGGSIEYGSFNSANAEAYISGPIIDGVQARLAGSSNISSGWQRSLSRPGDKQLGAKDQQALRGQVNIDLAKDSTLLIQGHWLRDKSDNIAPTPVDGRTLGLSSAQAKITAGTVEFSTGDNRAADWSPDQRPRRDNRQAGASAALNLALGRLALTSITAYDHFKRNEFNDYDGAAQHDANSHNISDIKAFSQEVRLADADDSDGLTWILGGYYSSDKLRENYLFDMPDSVYGVSYGLNTLNTRYRQKTTSIAGFGHAEFEIAHGLTLIGGARIAHETRRFAGCTYDADGTLANFVNNILIPYVITPAGLPVPGNIAAGGCSVYDDRADSPTYGTFPDAEERAATTKWMWKGGAQYQAGPSTLLYLTASSGFKSGGFNGANANLKSQQAAYRPERLTAYEAGLKTTLDSLGLYAEASAFYYDYRDKQTNGIAVTFVGNITGITNIPKSRIYGIDGLVRWSPVKGLTLEAAGTWLDSKVLNWTAVSSSSSYPTVITYDAAGLDLPNTPRWSINLTPQYRFDVGNSHQISAQVEYLYRSGTSGGINVYQNVESYDLVNAQLTFGARDGKWNVGIWGRNVFNRYYYTYAGLPGNANYVRVNGAPATYGVRLGVAL